MDYLVNSIGHVQLNAIEPAKLVAESTSILGLRTSRQSDTDTWLSSSSRAAELVVHQSSENAVRLLGFEAVSIAAVEQAAKRVAGAGCQLVSEEPSLECFAAGVTFETPQGHLIEIHSPAAEDLSANRHVSGGIGPKRLDHVNMTSPEPEATRDQFMAIMGLKLSERMADDGLSWMRGANGQHHCVGIVRGPTGLHHYSFEIHEFSDYCRLGDRLDTIGKNFIWGPGRHRPGDNTFGYYIDAIGAMVECSGSMSVIQDEDTFEPNVITQLKRPENIRVMNVWGEPAPPVWLGHQFLWSGASA